MKTTKTMGETHVINIDCEMSLDMVAFVQQHNLLVDIMGEYYNAGKDEVADMLSGILSLMDSIGDQGLEKGLWEFPEYDEGTGRFKEERYNDILDKLKNQR